MTDATHPTPRLLIAEDEPLLAAQLAHELAAAWPEARVVATVGDGLSAVQAALQHRPDVCLFDIRMPGQTGLEAAHALAEDWPDNAGPLPLLVFVTAYEQYAIDAFDRSAADYVLKPVQPARLARTVTTLRERLTSRMRTPHPAAAPADLGEWGRLLATLSAQLAGAPERGASTDRLRVLQVANGATIDLVPIDDVLMFEAADKYVRVLTAAREHLIRVSLRELLPRLDEAVFWQVHRGTVVRIDAVERAVRDESGRLTLHLRGCRDKPVVSRLYAHRFKAM
jgi:DNA-binding LytR/AlgR family response regulator